MDALNQLFSQYSFESLWLLIILLAVAFKFVNELFEYFYERVKKFFNYQSKKDNDKKNIINSLNDLRKSTENLQNSIVAQSEAIKQLKDHEKLTLERLQENSRNYIIDKHHYFCYEVKAIDDLNLQSLERRYLYYKAAGGDSFIDGLMEDIRALPRIDLSNKRLQEAIQYNDRYERSV
jgi:hypothetical protein